MKVLEIRNLSKTFPGGKKAVDDLSLSVEAGDIFGFIGHNGAGKTTTIRAVVGVMDFEQGEILINNVDIRRDPVFCKSQLAYLPDNPDLYDYLTGIQYLNFIADIFEVPADKRQSLIGRYADLFELTANLGDLISSYSHGMRQKLALIGALVHEPKLLVLDEPFVGLDPQAAFRVKEVFKELCQNGAAIFFSTHVLEVAEKLCNKIGIIMHGRLMRSGDTEDVRGDQSLESVFLELAESKPENEQSHA